MIQTYSIIIKQIETITETDLTIEGAKVKSFLSTHLFKDSFLEIGQSRVKQVSIHIIQDLNLTKCFTSVIIVIMRAIECIILGDM